MLTSQIFILDTSIWRLFICTDIVQSQMCAIDRIWYALMLYSSFSLSLSLCIIISLFSRNENARSDIQGLVILSVIVYKMVNGNTHPSQWLEWAINGLLAIYIYVCMYMCVCMYIITVVVTKWRKVLWVHVVLKNIFLKTHKPKQRW